jgi:glutathione S-transferase
MSGALDLPASRLASVLSWGVGATARHPARQPERRLELYEFESCPFCRKVREALSALDLDVMIYPCPPHGERFRPRVVSLGGRAMFPYLVDPNEDRALYESDDIVRYLAGTYGDGSLPLGLRLGPLTNLRSVAASAARPLAVRRRASRAPAVPLELWSFEPSPASRLAREVLSSLELPYVLHNVARGSSKRQALAARAGRFEVPYLVDPNTGREMFDPVVIGSYLQETYAA